MIARLKPLVSTRFWKLVVIATVFALPLLALNIGIMSAKRAWVSDDIDQQLLISDVHHGQPLDASFGQDTFILKYPLYALVGRVMPHDPEALVVTASVLMVAMLALFNVFQFLVHSSRRLGILLSLYVASIGGYALAFLIMPNIRNVELPAGLLTALTTSLYYSGKWRKTWPRTAILILVSAVQMVSDAYVFYFFLLPMSVGIVILLADKKQAVKDQLVYLAGVYVSWKVGVKVLAWLGLRELGQPINPPLHTLISSLGYALQGVVYILGDGQLTGSLWLNFLLTLVLAAGLLIVYRSYRSERINPDKNEFVPRWAAVYGLLVIVIDFLIYVASGGVNKTANHRYLIGSIFGLITMLIGLWCLGKRQTRMLIEVLVAILIVFYSAFNIVWAIHAPNVNNTVDTSEIVAFAKEHNVGVGFADYWDANINTYFDRGFVRVLPMTCTPSRGFQEYYWVTNMANFIPTPRLSETRFFIFVNYRNDQTLTKRYYATNSCSVGDFKKIFSARPLTIQKLNNQQTLILVGIATKPLTDHP